MTLVFSSTEILRPYGGPFYRQPRLPSRSQATNRLPKAFCCPDLEISLLSHNPQETRSGHPSYVSHGCLSSQENSQTCLSPIHTYDKVQFVNWAHKDIQKNKTEQAWVLGPTPLTPALRRQKQWTGLREFKGILIYIVSSGTVRST